MLAQNCIGFRVKGFQLGGPFLSITLAVKVRRRSVRPYPVNWCRVVKDFVPLAWFGFLPSAVMTVQSLQDLVVQGTGHFWNRGGVAQISDVGVAQKAEQGIPLIGVK